MYKVTKLMGEQKSFEREYYDMVRSGFAKYYFQVRLRINFKNKRKGANYVNTD